MNDTLPSTGRLGQVFGKFRLERKLGSGAMGEVFLGVHVALGHHVAVKVLSSSQLADPKGVARFANEARAVAAIGHENIAAIIDHDALPDGTPYIVMEYVEGTTLRELLVEHGALSLRQSAQVAVDVLAALSAAHAKGVVHRDLKPENVRLTTAGRAKVLDFGVAKLLQTPTPALTTEGALIGTPHYMAPEQVGGETIDARADLYAAGVMLFECATGQRPFDAENMVALLEKQLHAAPPWPSKLRPGFPPQLEQIILRALEKQPARRFESAEAMAAALRDLLPGLDGTAPLPTVTPAGAVYTPTRKEVATPGSPPAPEPKRSRLPLVALALTVVTVGAVVAASMTWKPEPVVVAKPVVVVAPVEPPKPPPPPAQPEAAPEPVPPPKPVAVVKTKSVPKPVKEPERQPEPEPAPPVRPSGVKLIETGGKSKLSPPDYDAKRFELFAYLPKAKQHAAELMSDVVLINVDSEGVGADGTADLTLNKEYEARYWFRSPSRSKVDPRLPERDQDIPCKVYVDVSAKGVETYAVTSSDGCKEKALPPWRCTMAEAMKRGAAAGARTDRVGKVTYLFDGTWMLDQGDGRGETVYFSCP